VSFRLKTILGIVSIVFCLLSALVASNHWYFKRRSDAHIVHEAHEAAQVLSTMLAGSVDSRDRVAIESHVSYVLAHDGLSFVRVRDAEGRVLVAAGDPAALAAPFVADRNIDTAGSDGRFDVAAPIIVRGSPEGGVELGLPVGPVDEELNELLLWNLALAGAGVFLVAGLGYLLGSLLTRQLAELRRGVERIGRGDIGHRLRVHGDDELAQTAACFNEMSILLAKKREMLDEQKAELERLALVASKVDEGILVTDGENRIEWVNEGCERLTGYSADELVGKNPQVIFEHAEDGPELARGWRDRLAKGEVVRSDVQIYTKSGKPLWIALGLTPVFDPAGRLVQVLAVQRDVTRRRWLELELKAHREHLERTVERRTAELEKQKARLQDALEAQKSLNVLQRAFVAMVSQEFRTPLAIIDAAAKRMRRRADELAPDEIAATTTKIAGSVVRLVRMIEDMLTAERIEGSEFELRIEDCDLAAIFRMCRQRQQELSPDHDIRLEVRDLPPTVRADPSVVEQVISNLLSNAVKYAPDEPLIEASAEQRGAEVVISVADHGVGIDTEDLPNMFRRFFRAKTSAGIAGTGIGLHLVKLMVERHEGSISVESRHGEGTRFEVRLPVDGPRERCGGAFSPPAAASALQPAEAFGAEPGHP